MTDAVGAGVGGLVRDGENGFVVPEQNDAALAQALEKVINEPGARLRTGAKQTIQRFTFARWADGFVDAVNYAAH